MTIASDYGLSLYDKYTLPDAPLFVGVECEIENIIDHASINTELFNVTTDGSLRNNGYEYVSIPLAVEKSVNAFTNLHATLKTGDQAFTNRTSIHVHANCANLEKIQVRSIIFLYALYEEAFFAMVDKERRSNIHCVALTETYLPSIYKEQLHVMYAKWHKYTALNIKPLGKYGTLEFRHMHGHNDAELYAEWVWTINKLFAVGKEIDVSVVALTEEFLFETFNELFGHTRIASNWGSIRGQMENQIIDIKLIG